MPISKKRRNQILNAISSATLAVLNEHVPEWKESAPDNWTDDIREKCDLIWELERKAYAEVERVLTSC